MAGNQREAAVKLTLDGGQYLVNLRQIGDETEKAQRRATQSAGAWGAGVSKVGDNFKALGGHVKNVIGLAATVWIVMLTRGALATSLIVPVAAPPGSPGG